MKLVQLRIKNFSGIRQATINFERHTCVIGMNNAGKTSIADAIGLLLGREKRNRRLSDYDFYGGDTSKINQFSIEGVIADFASQDVSSFPTIFDLEKGAVPVSWNRTTRLVSNSDEGSEDSELAIEIGVAGRYIDDECDFETRHYFVDGDTNPFAVDPYVGIPRSLLREIGLQYLTTDRKSERSLALGTFAFQDLLRSESSLPHDALESIRGELRKPTTTLEQNNAFEELLDRIGIQLKEYGLLDTSAALKYRVTNLDIESVMRSLNPFVEMGERLLPLSASGSGSIAIQNLLVILEMVKHKRKEKENSIVVVEEPELHLHPAIQSKIVHELRSSANQVIVTTHSPILSSSFSATEIVHLRRGTDDEIHSTPFVSGAIGLSDTNNPTRRLFNQHRVEFVEAIMNKYVIVPEGLLDRQWLNLFKAFVGMSTDPGTTTERHVSQTKLLSFAPTPDAKVVDTVAQCARFHDGVLALVDGDSDGDRHIADMLGMKECRPHAIIQWLDGWSIEHVAAWVLQPASNSLKEQFSSLFSAVETMDTDSIASILLDERQKHNWSLHEEMVWAAADCEGSIRRANLLLERLAAVCSEKPNGETIWDKQSLNGISIFKLKTLPE